MGRKQFEQVVAQAPKKQLKQLYVDRSAIVLAAGATEAYVVLPTPGTVAQLLGLRLQSDAPTGATSGSHQIYIGYETTNGAGRYVDLAYGSATFGNSISFNDNIFQAGAGANLIPVNEGSTVNALKDCYFDSNLGFRIAFGNSTNVPTTANTNKRSILITYLEEEVR